MISPRSTPDRRRLLAIFTRLLVAAAALPMLAPTCGTGNEGWKTFSRNSLIIPMDVCYQSQRDGSNRATVHTPTDCPGTQDPGNVIKAYGLVYQLVRNNIAVYWVIDQQKTSLKAPDLAVQYGSGFPVQKYDWAARQPGAAPATTPVAPAGGMIRYRGGPFIVDGSDYERALQVLRSFEGTFGPASGSAVNLHISNVAFRGWTKKTMAGGWSAGGTVPPKLALLDIGSGNLRGANSTNVPPATRVTDPKNAQPVIRGYLVEAGIGTGTAEGSAAGPHGEIYDRLTIEDFQPAAGSTDPRTSRLFTNGYEILWVPHWVAPGSCTTYTSTGGLNAEQNCWETSAYGRSSNRVTQAQIDRTLQTIGAFVGAGKDLFAECAGMGSFEGAFRYRRTGTAESEYTLDYSDGDPTTRFQTPLGLRYNEVDTNSSVSGVQFPAPDFPAGSFGSPLLQIGDYSFSPLTGAIEDFRPQDSTSYLPGVTRLITGSGDFSSWDFFTVRPGVAGQHGTIVYLGGHSYSGVQGTFQVAGSRLVLNTLFNLGAACTASGVACDTGQLGVCGRGVIQCVNGEPACVQNVQKSAEICDGLDNDCNGLVDDMDAVCYDGPTSSINPSTGQPYGLCTRGVRSCQLQPNGTYAMSACSGQVLPTSELCNGLDDDCDGTADETLTQACYTGPSTSIGPDGLPQGFCKAGTQRCTDGSWEACTGQQLPGPELCGTPFDENCDGQVNEIGGAEGGCGSCTPNTTLVGCYTGPSGTANVGLCRTGTQNCSADGTYGPCAGQVVPTLEVCSPASCAQTPTDPACNQDEDCDGDTDEGCGCSPGDTESCYGGPTDTEGVGVCRAGKRACDAGVFTGACLGEIRPAPEACDGQDNDCDGQVDVGAVCNNGFTCEHGVCVPDDCGVENQCPDGYRCDGTPARCVRDECPAGSGIVCGDGETCSYGLCTDACPAPGEPSSCWPGSFCQGTGLPGQTGQCMGGGCYYTGCPSGQLCQQGACRPDACAGVACPAGTFCRQGDCVQSCTYVSCGEGEKCGADGFCERDACAGRTCGPTEKCVDGACIQDVCLGKSCGLGQICKDQVCVDDPCTGVVCPVGQCLGGQCYPLPTPASTNPEPVEESDGGGCGQGAPGALSALLLLALLPLARRRRAPARVRILPLLAVAVLAGSACGEKRSETFDAALCTDVNYPACEGETRCINISEDAAHCGGCGAACKAGERCVNKVCGPANAVAPRITSLSPATGDQGQATPLTVIITGDRFAEGAALRLSSDRGTRTLATEYIDASHVRAQLDLSSSTPDTLYMRVVNPDRVISNPAAFDVITPTPSISSLDPAEVNAGTLADGSLPVIRVVGTGFLPSSLCRLRGSGFAQDIVLPIEHAGVDLLCTLDTTVLGPGDYELRVATPADPDELVSLPAALRVKSKTPVLTDVSPNQGEANSLVTITLGGSGFDPTSIVLFDGKPVGTTYVDSTVLNVVQTTLPTAGVYSVSVRNGTSPSSYTSSGTMSFTVGGAPPTVTTISPASAYQGDASVTLRVTGMSFPSQTMIQLAPPGGAWRAAVAATVNGAGTEVATTAPVSFVGQPAGDWLVRLCYGNPCTAASATSPTIPLRVLTNRAILQNATPRTAAQGTSPTVTMTVSNLRPSGSAPSYGIAVKFSGREAVIPATSVSGNTVQVPIDTSGLLTGTYTLQVRNPNGAEDSNTLSFNVTPGVPTLTRLSPSSAAIGPNAVEITLTGTNFSRPDLSGNGGSSVHVSSALLDVTDWSIPSFRDCTVAHPLPWACVDRVDTIVVHLDTRDAVPGTYDVQVWNPGGPTPPQKSNLLTGAFTITP